MSCGDAAARRGVPCAGSSAHADAALRLAAAAAQLRPALRAGSVVRVRRGAGNAQGRKGAGGYAALRRWDGQRGRWIAEVLTGAAAGRD
eukprot:gene36767-15361_t